MNVIWSPEAIDDLVALRAYLEKESPAAARRVALHIVQCVEEMLPVHPDVGRPGRVPGTRELVVPTTPFLVPYRVRASVVEVLRVYHGARRWPDRF